MWDDYSASDEKIHNFFEILPNTLDNIRQGYSGITLTSLTHNIYILFNLECCGKLIFILFGELTCFGSHV